MYDVHHMYAVRRRRPEEGIISTRVGVPDIYEPSCGCWEWNPDFLKAKSDNLLSLCYLQPFWFFFLRIESSMWPFILQYVFSSHWLTLIQSFLNKTSIEPDKIFIGIYWERWLWSVRINFSECCFMEIHAHLSLDSTSKIFFNQQL